MRDSLARVTPLRAVDPEAKARSLHALGAFYLRQGFPKQGLSLLLAARDYGLSDPAIDRAVAQAYLLSGAPKKALQTLDALEDDPETPNFRESSDIIRSRALLALGRIDEARAIFAGKGRT
jgi:tetratricopeptide (TPR) repeat protein